MPSVGVNPPKTPVTEGSNDIAAATLPNVCKMPGPPAPFVPTPLPNIGRSGDSLSKATKKVKIEGKKIAIKGSYYMSKLSGDMVSKGTGGGIITAATEGKTKFVAPGSMNVKAEGKNIQLLGDAMTNNGSNGGNAATVSGNMQGAVSPHVQACANALCDAACEAIGKGQSSDELEKSLDKANTPLGIRCKNLGLKFRTFRWQKVATKTANRYSRKVQKVIGTGKHYGQVLVKPDIILGGTLKGKEIIEKVKQCFDFKLKKDAVGRSIPGSKYKKHGDQMQRQKQLANGKRSIIIGCPAEGGVCTSCANC